MSRVIRFRVGREILLGEVTEFSNGIYSVSSNGDTFAVHNQFVLGESEGSLSEQQGQIDHAAILLKQLLPCLMSEREFPVRDKVLLSLNSSKKAICLEDRDTKKVTWVSANTFLEMYPRAGGMLALESFREDLVESGLIKEKGPIEDLLPLTQSLEVFMKRNPFRDMTRLHEGTYVEIKDYDRGCAVLVADGEKFWFPLEESIKKDQEYYSTLDYNRDGVPDPLEYLPSKSALGKKDVGPRNNYNSNPPLDQVAGHFSPMDDISMEESFSILKEGYGALIHYHDEAENSPTHPSSSELADALIKGTVTIAQAFDVKL